MFAWLALSGSLNPSRQPQLVEPFAWASALAVTAPVSGIIGTKPTPGAEMPSVPVDQV